MDTLSWLEQGLNVRLQALFKKQVFYELCIG